MGRTAYGVRGIKLRDGDEVVAMELVSEGGTLLTVCENGYGKRTELDEYRAQSRGGIGLINIQTIGSQRQGRRHRVRHRRRRTDARHRTGPDHSHEGRRPAADRPRHAGRAADRCG